MLKSLTWKAWSVVLMAGFLFGVVVFVGLQVAAHAWSDHQQIHAIVGIINTNLQAGRLVLPAASAPAPAAQPRPPEKQP